MAVCKLAQDILKSTFCGYSLKQIVELYLANAEDVTATTVGAPKEGAGGAPKEGAGGVEVKTITLAAQAKFYKIEPAKDSATFEDSLQVGDGGSKYRQSSITWNISGEYTPQMVDVLDALSLGRFVIVARLSDGNYVMFGRLTPMEAETASLSSAAEATGFNGVTVTFTNATVESPLPLSAEAIKTVLDTAAAGA